MYNHQLDTFIQVAELGSFSKAASALYISPTAVIKQMNILESNLGATLFNRTHQGLTLTSAGKSLLSDARHIIRACDEAAERARKANDAERNVIRIGSSPMTPSGFFSDMWPMISRELPNSTLKLVIFENTPENARRILANLGEDIDIVAGVFDDDFLASRRCAALELSRQPLRLMLSSSHPLASKEVLELKDLADQKVLVNQRGWNHVTDAVADDLRASGIPVEVEEYEFINVDMFNRCEEEGALLVAIDPWKDVHPLLSCKPVAWGYEVPFGIMHAPEPSAKVQTLLDAVSVLTAQGD
ncbi:LysR family transcriptional regulator [Anaerotardibacter muris]|uniref:LysR family transcriptional regulator n=1 Tax=Anaerotardibacter muris TaxID=2941505 RepID=UPI002042398B|nr:LysR family transcriptional regulator [Anaerotardibacter muris]